MPSHLTRSDVLQLAPEKKRQGRALKLAFPQKWQSLQMADSALWGEIKGSGQQAYQVCVQLDDPPRYKCTCRSREFPCKHVLALLLLHTDHIGAFTKATPPPDVATWLRKQAKRATQAAHPRAVNPKTLARRQREIASGLDDLDQWLRDLVRTGLATVQGKPTSFYTKPARRLVDAKAPALADRVRALADIPTEENTWASQVLTELAQIHLIVQGFRRFDALTPEHQADLRAALGWYVGKNELTDDTILQDTWLVVGVTHSLQDHLRMQRLWLYGQETGKYALLLDFKHGAREFENRYQLGETFVAELVYYPSAFPLRAAVQSQHTVEGAAVILPGYASLHEAVGAYAAALACNPWLGQFPVALRAVTPLRGENGWVVVDERGDMLPLSSSFRETWDLYARSGGHPLWVFGEWDGETLYPLAMAENQTIVSLMGDQ